MVPVERSEDARQALAMVTLRLLTQQRRALCFAPRGQLLLCFPARPAGLSLLLTGRSLKLTCC